MKIVLLVDKNQKEEKLVRLKNYYPKAKIVVISEVENYINQLKKVLLDKGIDCILIWNFFKDKEKIQNCIDFLLTNFKNSKIFISDDIYREILEFLPISMVSIIADEKFFPIMRKPKDKDGFRRVFDIIASVLLIITFSPLFLLISILVKLSSYGPVFFISTRIGEKGKPFRFLKFRSLKVVSENREKLRAKEMVKVIKKNNQPVVKIVDKKRLTTVGMFLRKTALDEIPQFFHVLKGEMSLVGPRPCLPYEWNTYTAWQKRRLDIKPGCTGVWQVYGKGKVNFDGMVAMDLFYVYNSSFWLDLKLILETIRIMFKGMCDN